MNLNQLEYFINVAETLSFTKAANKCYISQTAMTQQIKALEKNVGVPLLIRDKHHVELTPAGTVFLKEARAILERSNAAFRLARTAATGVEGKITIGYIRGYGQSELVKTLRNFHQAYPRIQISFLRDNSSGLINSLEKGECDVIFNLTPFHQTYSSTEHLYLNSFPLMVVLDTGHILSSKKVLTYSDLKEENFIIMQPSGRAKDEAEESMLIYNRGGYFPNIVALEREPETLYTMVSIGLGICILPEYIVRSYQKSQDIKIIPLVKEDGSAETLDFELCWPKVNTSPAVDSLIEAIEQNNI